MSILQETINETNYKEALRLANKLRYANDPEMRARINEKKGNMIEENEQTLIIENL